MAVNGDTWASLSDETKSLIKASAAKVENEIWDSIEKNDATALACNASGPCPWGEPGGMTPVVPSAEDQANVKSIVENFVLKRFAERCGKACAEEWNATMGDIAGVQAPL